MRRLPELLAPAGSMAALQAAVAAGADAVYLSGKRFGARKFAENFDEPALAGAIDYAHLRGVRVYVTVNTLIRDNELYDAAAYLLKLIEKGGELDEGVVRALYDAEKDLAVAAASFAAAAFGVEREARGRIAPGTRRGQLGK